MNPLEIAATVFTLICVVLGVKRSLWQFPFGVVGTGLFFFVVWGQQLYANSILQLFFLTVQFYGWWYWLRGDKGKRPPVRSTSIRLVLSACAASLILAAGFAILLDRFTDQAMALPDAANFGLSIVAQILLDRKRVETWPVWIVVNLISIWLFASQQLWLFTALYVFFFFNAFWGWWEWRNAMRREAAAPAQAAT